MDYVAIAFLVILTAAAVIAIAVAFLMESPTPDRDKISREEMVLRLRRMYAEDQQKERRRWSQ